MKDKLMEKKHGEIVKIIEIIDDNFLPRIKAKKIKTYSIIANKLLSLLNSEVEKERERLLGAEEASIKKVLEQTAKYRCGYHMRVRKLLKDRLKALSDIGGKDE